MPSKLILTIGLPGSGKSTWAREQPDAIVVERDDIRKMLTGSHRDHSREMNVTKVQRDLVMDGLRSGCTVIISDTNLKRKYRKGWRKIAEAMGAEYEEVYLFIQVPVEECIRRDALRDDPVGEAVIRRMWDTWASEFLQWGAK